MLDPPAFSEGRRAELLDFDSDDGGVEILVMTFWDSMDSVRRFAGADCDSAVVEPEARAALAQYDDFVRHYEVHEPR